MTDHTTIADHVVGELRRKGLPTNDDDSVVRRRRRPSDPLRPCSIEGCESPAKGRGWCNRHYVRFFKHGHPTAGGRDRPKKGEVRAFLEDAIACDHDECIRWPYAQNGLGYGQVVIDGNRVQTHRYVCERMNGPAPADDSIAAHSCGKGHEGCISPRHLSWKSPKGNHEDQVRHGTAIRGARVGSAKLTDADVIAIRKKLKAGAMQKEIAAEYGLHQSSVSMIATGKNWRWLTTKKTKPATAWRAA